VKCQTTGRNKCKPSLEKLNSKPNLKEFPQIKFQEKCIAHSQNSQPAQKPNLKERKEEGRKRQAGKLNHTCEYIFLCKKAELSMCKWKFIFPFP